MTTHSDRRTSEDVCMCDADGSAFRWLTYANTHPRTRTISATSSMVGTTLKACPSGHQSGAGFTHAGLSRMHIDERTLRIGVPENRLDCSQLDPFSVKCVAYECHSVWQITLLDMSASTKAELRHIPMVPL